MIEYLQISPPNAEDVNSLLAWIVGVLASFIAGVLLYLRLQNKERIDDLKNQISELKLQLQKELDYNKEQDNANIKLITDTGNILNTSIKLLENNSGVLGDIKVIQVNNQERLKEIKTHLEQNGR